ncbi:MAG: cysteine peptidase family C39 domain-containing protein [Methanobacteriaceae archaeon]
MNLQNIGFNATGQELKVLAGTNNETGTSMYGLARAAHAKGVSATGMRLSVDDLRTNHIVHVTIDGEGHYSVVREITETSVYLADPSKGNIVLSREEFSAIFTGNVLVISDPNMQVNQTETTNQTNITAPVSVQSENSPILTSETLQTIRGRGGRNRAVWRRWGWIIYLCNLTTNRISIGMATAGGIASALGVSKVVTIPIMAAGGLLGMVNAGRGVRVWVTRAFWSRPPQILWIAAQ